MKKLLASVLLAVTLAPAARLKELTSIEGVRDNQLMGYGLVVGLAFNPSDNLTIKTELQSFNDTSFGIGASFHF